MPRILTLLLFFFFIITLITTSTLATLLLSLLPFHVFFPFSREAADDVIILIYSENYVVTFYTNQKIN